jgi:hypothetical protein
MNTHSVLELPSSLSDAFNLRKFFLLPSRFGTRILQEAKLFEFFHYFVDASDLVFSQVYKIKLDILTGCYFIISSSILCTAVKLSL